MIRFFQKATNVGLNVSAALPISRLSTNTLQEIQKKLPKQTCSLILLGSSGTGFFERFLQKSSQNIPDPLDSYTVTLVNELLKKDFPFSPLSILFPFRAPFLPFQRFAKTAGLGYPGPLGVLVHPVYGPWFALRAAIAISEFYQTPFSSSDVCLNCEAPCVSACPGGAVHKEKFEISLCGQARKEIDDCASRCLAREACPVGTIWRYNKNAIEFHHKAAGKFFV